jgi:hypothetical protein
MTHETTVQTIAVDDALPFAFMGFHVPRDGYGYATIKLARALERLGVPGVDMQTDAGAFGEIGERQWAVAGHALALCVPDWLPAISATRLASYTMFEATRLPEGWADAINRRAGVCVVPCAWCEAVFADSGVRVPIRIAKWGVDAYDYFPLDRTYRRDEPYTFLWSGTPDRRKGWDVAYRAFINAFGGERDDVQLILHFRELPRGVVPGAFADRNVQVCTGLFDRPQLRRLLAGADCFVFPSRGEGWGAPPREAAATGLPVIATNYGGLAEDIKHWALPLGVKGMSQADYGWWDAGTIGEWAEPDGDQLVALMRWCAEHREEASAFGVRAASWLARNARWEATAEALVRVMEEFA